MRINKFLGETGVCSRREADQWIAAGRVSVNGVTAVLGTKVDDGDEVRLDGKPLAAKPKRVYLALNKPIGVECTTDTGVPGNIVDFVGHDERIFPIGRLDKESEGLILLTNDGDIVNRVLRAEHEHEKEYIVSVDRPLTPEFLRGMANGVPVLDTITNPCKRDAGWPEHVPHRVDTGSESTDPAHVRVLRLHRAAAAARAHHAHPAGLTARRQVAEPHARRGRSVAARGPQAPDAATEEIGDTLLFPKQVTLTCLLPDCDLSWMPVCSAPRKSRQNEARNQHPRN